MRLSAMQDNPSQAGQSLAGSQRSGLDPHRAVGRPVEFPAAQVATVRPHAPAQAGKVSRAEQAPEPAQRRRGAWAVPGQRLAVDQPDQPIPPRRGAGELPERRAVPLGERIGFVRQQDDLRGPPARRCPGRPPGTAPARSAQTLSAPAQRSRSSAYVSRLNDIHGLRQIGQKTRSRRRGTAIRARPRFPPPWRWQVRRHRSPFPIRSIVRSLSSRVRGKLTKTMSPEPIRA